jgi:hypothetical protein
MKKRPTESSDPISQRWTASPFFVGYLADAELRSARRLELEGMLRDAKSHLQFDVQPESQEAQRWAERLRQICSKYGLADPLKYSHGPSSSDRRRPTSRRPKTK